MNEEQLIHRAPWVLPVSAPLIDNGAVAVAAGRITHVGRFADLRTLGGRVVDHEEAVLTPGLVNCHAHLELSCYAVPSDEDVGPHAGITDWITQLLARRDQGPDQAAVAAAYEEAARGMAARGIAVVADTGNEAALLLPGRKWPLEITFMRELIAPNAAAAQAALDTLAHGSGHFTAHALYSTTAPVVRAVKKHCRAHGRLFSIHVAESAAEVEFLRTGGGPFADFLRARAGLPASAPLPPDMPAACGQGPVATLHRLGVLDERTLCVHAVHVDNDEINLLAATGAHVCLCPGSNRYLGVGTAPLTAMLEAGVRPCLGTDSAASNPALDLWRELRLLAAAFPHIDPLELFSCATMAGATALGVTDDYGCLAPGRRGRFLAVRGFGGRGGDIGAFLVSGEVECSWV